MPDRSIPFYNTILRCDNYQPEMIDLKDGFSIVPFRPGYEKAWANLEYSIEDFDSVEEAENYFVSTYLNNQNEFNNILFMKNREGEIIGSCIAWHDERNGALVSSLHWLVVDERYQGMGLGRALCCAVMNIFAGRSSFPVYIHTQPWSWKAILLYDSLGFRLQKTDTFSDYVNQYTEAMATIKGLLSDEKFKILQMHSEE